MDFNVFLTYSMDADEQSLVWRLQTLATAQGINVYVPARAGAQSGGRLGVRGAIDRADCVLAIITSKAGVAVQNELNYALSRNKIVVPIVQEGIANQKYFGKFPRVFSFSPLESPGRLESEVAEYLAKQKLSKEGQQTVGAVVTIGVGMLLLYALSRD